MNRQQTLSSSMKHSESTDSSFTVYKADGYRKVCAYQKTTRHVLDLDHFIPREQQILLHRKLRDKRHSLHITLVIPTQNSEDYLTRTLQNVTQQIRKTQQAHPKWHIELIIAINGVNQMKTIAQARLLQSEMITQSIQLTVFNMEGITGKIKAINASIAYAKQQKSDIIGLIDDDVMLSENAITTTVTCLIENDEMFLVAPKRRPLSKPPASKGLFARLEFELRQEEKHPTGACLFLPTETYAPIPDNIILDDEALKYYYALPDNHVDPFARMKLAAKAEVYFKLIGDQRLFWLRRIRLRTGAEQLASIFSETKSRVRRARLDKSKPFWRQDFFTALTTKDKYCVAIYFFYYRTMLVLIRTLVSFKIRVRKVRGHYPYYTQWYKS